MEQNLVHSVDKAMSILEVMLKYRRELSIKELSEITGYPKSTIHALLSTMRKHDVIEQDNQTGKYSLGFRLFECGCAVSSSWNIGKVAHVYLEKLADLTDASAFIAYFNGNNAIYFDQCSNSLGLQVIPSIGYRMPLHATSQGKVFLSLLSNKKVFDIVEKTGLQAYTPHTITDPEQLIENIDTVRKNGYAIEDGEYRIGLRTAATPIYDSDGNVNYALGIAGLFRRVQSDDFQNAVENLLNIARELSLALGWREK